MFLFNFYGYYTLLMDILLITMIKNAIWNANSQNWCQSSPEYDEYIRIYEHFQSEYLSGYLFVSKLWYEYIRIFVHVKKFHTNVFGYSFVSFSWHKYVRIFIGVKIHKNVTLCMKFKSVRYCDSGEVPHEICKYELSWSWEWAPTKI